MEFSLLGNALVAALALYGALWYDARRGNATECTESLWDAAIGASIAGLVVGRLWAMAASGVNPLTNPADIIIVRSGIATGPAAFAALVTLGYLFRADIPRHLDALAPAALVGLAGLHGGCVVRATCLGTATDLPWGIAQAGSTITRHPVGMYSAVAFLLAAIVVTFIRSRLRRAPGVAGGIAIAAAGAIRLLTEPLRSSLGSGPEGWYIAGIMAGIATAVLAYRRAPGRVEPTAQAP